MNHNIPELFQSGAFQNKLRPFRAMPLSFLLNNPVHGKMIMPSSAWQWQPYIFPGFLIG